MRMLDLFDGGPGLAEAVASDLEQAERWRRSFQAGLANAEVWQARLVQAGTLRPEESERHLASTRALIRRLEGAIRQAGGGQLVLVRRVHQKGGRTMHDTVQTLTQAQVQAQLAALLPELILEPEPTVELLLRAKISLTWLPEEQRWRLRTVHPTRGVRERAAWGLPEVTQHIERLALWVLGAEE